jgi:hypothetical protein
MTTQTIEAPTKVTRVTRSSDLRVGMQVALRAAEGPKAIYVTVETINPDTHLGTAYIFRLGSEESHRHIIIRERDIKVSRGAVLDTSGSYGLSRYERMHSGSRS